MSITQPSPVPEQRTSAPINLNLASNNPFRNGAPSPSLTNESNISPRNPLFNHRPVSRNPFFEALESDKNSTISHLSPQLARPMPAAGMATSTVSDFNVTTSTAEHLAGLSLGDRPLPREPEASPSTTVEGDRNKFRLPSRSENQPPRRAPPPPGGHRSMRSRDEDSRVRISGDPPTYRPGPRPRDQLDIFADPSPGEPSRPRGPVRRARRNSDSSVADARSGKLLDPDDERRRADRRRREERHRREREREREREQEREHEGEREGERDRDGKPRERTSRSSPKAKKPNQRLDLIDKLDVTSIYGTGLFHHDGPFDACNPHRNRKDSRRAPMQAFPKDSANNAIGGSGPLHKDIDHNLFHGNRGAEAFSDFSRSGTDAASYSSYSGDKTRRPSTTRALSQTPTFQRSEHSTPRAFDAIARVDPVHGDESLGLGTSTFLEGAPASRLAIKRRESESDQGLSGAGGLGRKKSLAQKIRGMNSTRQANRGAAAARVQSPTRPELPHEAGEVVAPRKISSGPSTTTNSIAVRPFSSDSLGEIRAPIAEAAIEHAETSAADYDAAYDQKGASIEMARRQGSTQRTTRQGLTRAITHDSSAAGSSAEEPVKQSGGILSRMKSLRGG